ncbi:tetraspanin Tsp2 [Umbelopsis sp. PMI_123]|nr:tetraspanin Tsp2 [Umbelopsis sp. PMI_123]
MAQLRSSVQAIGSSHNISPWNSAEYLPTPPVLPWIPNSERSSFRTSVDASSLHVMKRFNPSTVDNQTKKRRRWTVHKWWMLVSNTILFIYGLGGVLLAVLTYFKLYLRADVIIVTELLLLRLVTAAGSICLVTSFVGYAGIMLNNRAILTIYNVLLWPCFALIAAIGYVSYRKNKWNLEGKLSYQWHYLLSADDRARIQANLHCCGYKSFTDFHERSNKCFPRTLLPGCKFKYQTFTRQCLVNCYIAAFSLIPLHIFVLVTALLCSNHINRKFGKGLPPKIYRLDYQGLVAGTPTGSSVNLSRVERKRVVSQQPDS